MPRKPKDPSRPPERRRRPHGKITLGPLRSDLDIDAAIQFVIRLVANGDMVPQVGNCLFYGFGMLAKGRLLKQNAEFEERIKAYEMEQAAANAQTTERPEDATLN